MRMELNGLVFNDAQPDVDGVYWYITEWEGWDAPDLRQAMFDATSKHGSVIVESMLSTRALSLKGVVKAPNEMLFWAAFNKLSGATSRLYDPVPFSAWEGTTEKALWVVRAGKVMKRMIGGSSFEFEVPLTAPDPLKYGSPTGAQSIAAGATVSLTNVGNFTTKRITVTTTSGGTLKLTSQETGQSLTSGNTPVGNNTVYDFHMRTAYRDDKPRYFQLSTTSEWWGLEPGANSIKNEGTANVSITYRPAWV